MNFFFFSFFFFSFFSFQIFCQPPPVPTWPSAFSGEIYQVTGTFTPISGVWYYDSVLNCERLDRVLDKSKPTFQKVIRNHTAGIEYNITTIGTRIACTQHALNSALINPSFKNWNYLGNKTIIDTTCSYWTNPKPQNLAPDRYYDDIEASEPKRIEWMIGRLRESITFFSFDAGRQDPTLFHLTTNDKKVCSSTYPL